MNFFERQQKVRRLSMQLVFLLGVAIIAIVAVVDIVVVFALGAVHASTGRLIGTITVASVLTAGAIGLATLYRSATLAGGGGRVARELGGDYVPQDTTDPQLRRLRNIIEEIAIASGVAVPEIYVLQHESGINAFAAGWSPSDAAIAVTRGALDRLNRDELQGVIAHEFSHIVNGDMRLNIRLIGLLFGILFLGLAGETLLRGSAFDRGRRDNNPLPLIGIALLVVGFVGVFFGRIIKASVSRQREYLADASAVQFTRQTAGIAGALKKIGGLTTGSKLASPKTEEVSHMLFGAGKAKASLFATHPPLLERIKVLEPSFNPEQLDQLATDWAKQPPNGMAEDLALGLAPDSPASDAGRPAAAGLAAQAPPRQPTTAASVAAQVAQPTEHSYEHAAGLLSQVPPDVQAKFRSVDEVVPLVFGLSLASEAAVRDRQLAEITKRWGPTMTQASLASAESVAALPRRLQLPLAQLALPALRHRPIEAQQAILATIDALANADGFIDVFEYCITRQLHRELYDATHPRRGTGTASAASRRAAILTLLATLAKAGHSDPNIAASAFSAGVQEVLPGERARYTPVDVLGLDPVWPALDGLSPAARQRLVRACIEVVMHDGELTADEAELIRLTCSLLNCPLPPIVIS